MNEGIVETLELLVESKLKTVHTMLPGKIESYSGHSERKAKVKALVKIRTNKGTLLQIPPIDNVPVIFPSSGDFSLLFPLKKGDGCLICFSEEGIGSFLKGQTEVSADSLAKFSLTDAICIPGLFSFKSVPTSSSTIEIDDSGNILIDSNADIRLNGSSKYFVTHSELNTALQNFMTALNLHTHPTAAVGAPSPPTVPMTLDISSAKTSTVKTGG